MFLKVLSVFLLCYLLRAQAATFRTKSKNLIQSRIVGGKNADRGQFPYHVLLTYRHHLHYFCGATILTSRYILSAAHCVSKSKYDTSEILAILNTANYRDSNFTAIEISKSYGHPEYTFGNLRFDISILLTRQEIVFNDFIQPVQLPTMDYTQASGHEAVIAGFGALWEPKTPDDCSPRPENLQFQHTTTLSAIDCLASYKQMIGDTNDPSWIMLDRNLDKTLICTKNKVGTGTCFGDSGGGVVVNNTLVGIVSTSLGHALGYPDINTNIYSYLGWIITHMKRMSGETYI